MGPVKRSSTHQSEQYDRSQNAYSLRLHHDSPQHDPHRFRGLQHLVADEPASH
jgi:hypothetical protein